MRDLKRVIKWIEKIEIKSEEMDKDMPVDEDGFLKSFIEVRFDDDNKEEKDNN